MKRRIIGSVLSAALFLAAQTDIGAQQPQPPADPLSAFQTAPDGKSLMIRCGSPPSLDSFQYDLATIAKAGTPLAASAEIHLPAPGRILSLAPSQACSAFLPEVQVEALRRANLFGTLDLRRDALADGRPTGAAEGFMLWVEDGQLYAAYGAGPRLRLAALSRKLSDWAKGAATNLTQVKDYASWHNDVVLGTYYGHEPYYNINGVEYDLAKAKDFLAQRFANSDTTPAAKPLAKHARIILAPVNGVTGAQLHTAPGLVAFSRAVSAWRAEVIRKSGLFESVSIEESTTIPAPAAGEVVFAAKGPALNAIALAPDKLQVIPEGQQGLVVTSITGPNYEMTFMRAPNDAAQWTDQVREAVSKL